MVVQREPFRVSIFRKEHLTGCLTSKITHKDFVDTSHSIKSISSITPVHSIISLSLVCLCRVPSCFVYTYAQRICRGKAQTTKSMFLGYYYVCMSVWLLANVAALVQGFAPSSSSSSAAAAAAAVSTAARRRRQDSVSTTHYCYHHCLITTTLKNAKKDDDFFIDEPSPGDFGYSQRASSSKKEESPPPSTPKETVQKKDSNKKVNNIFSSDFYQNASSSEEEKEDSSPILFQSPPASSSTRPPVDAETTMTDNRAKTNDNNNVNRFFNFGSNKKKVYDDKQDEPFMVTFAAETTIVDDDDDNMEEEEIDNDDDNNNQANDDTSNDADTSIAEHIPWPQQIENFKCIFLGLGVGIWSVLPFTAFHYFVYQPSYTSLPQWEFDTYTGAIQGALFCLSLRYALRKAAPQALHNQVVQSFVGVRTLSRIKVSFECTALPLYCKFVMIVIIIIIIIVRTCCSLFVPRLPVQPIPCFCFSWGSVDCRWGRLAVLVVGHGGTIGSELCRIGRLVWGRGSSLAKCLGSGMDPAVPG